MFIDGTKLQYTKTWFFVVKSTLDDEKQQPKQKAEPGFHPVPKSATEHQNEPAVCR